MSKQSLPFLGSHPETLSQVSSFIEALATDDSSLFCKSLGYCRNLEPDWENMMILEACSSGSVRILNYLLFLHFQKHKNILGPFSIELNKKYSNWTILVKCILFGRQNGLSCKTISHLVYLLLKHSANPNIECNSISPLLAATKLFLVENESISIEESNLKVSLLKNNLLHYLIFHKKGVSECDSSMKQIAFFSFSKISKIEASRNSSFFYIHLQSEVHRYHSTQNQAKIISSILQDYQNEFNSKSFYIVNIIQQLIEKGANVNFTSNSKETPLSVLFSAFPTEESLLAIKYLLMNGASPSSLKEEPQVFQKISQHTSQELQEYEKESSKFPSRMQDLQEENTLQFIQIKELETKISKLEETCQKVSNLEREIESLKNKCQQLNTEKQILMQYHNSEGKVFVQQMKLELDQLRKENRILGERCAQLEHDKKLLSGYHGNVSEMAKLIQQVQQLQLENSVIKEQLDKLSQPNNQEKKN